VNWQSIGAADEPFPKSIRELQLNKSGVYAIRERGTFFTTVVYVGESHTGNLYKTMTRHFQRWSRGKKFWKGAYSPAQTDPGHTYARESIEVAFQVCPRGEALALQEDWIRRLQPRDNSAAAAEETPF